MFQMMETADELRDIRKREEKSEPKSAQEEQVSTFIQYLQTQLRLIKAEHWFNFSLECQKLVHQFVLKGSATGQGAVQSMLTPTFPQATFQGDIASPSTSYTRVTPPGYYQTGFQPYGGMQQGPMPPPSQPPQQVAQQVRMPSPLSFSSFQSVPSPSFPRTGTAELMPQTPMAQQYVAPNTPNISPFSPSTSSITAAIIESPQEQLPTQNPPVTTANPPLAGALGKIIASTILSDDMTDL